VDPGKIGHFFGGISFNSTVFAERLLDGIAGGKSLISLVKITKSMSSTSHVNYIFEPASPQPDVLAWVFPRIDAHTVFYAPPFATLKAFAPPNASLRDCMTSGTIGKEEKPGRIGGSASLS
jgi:hypothetical protein